MNPWIAQRAIVVATTILTLTGASSAFAQNGKSSESTGQSGNESTDSRAQCFAAHTEAQELKRGGKLIEAREKLQICSAVECPGVLIEDCGNWMRDLEQTTPSMVFEVKLDQKDADDAQVFVDGVPVEDLVGGFEVNPGRHTVRAVLPPFEPITQTVTLPAGQRMRLLSFEFESEPVADETPQPAAQVRRRPTPVGVYPLLGVGVAGLATFGVMAGLGKGEQNELEDTCAPSCTDDDLSKMETMYLIGDISAGVGAAALVTAGIIYLTRPTKYESVPPVAFTFDPRGGAGIVAAGRF